MKIAEDTFHDMTDEEYDALDEELTRIVPKLGANGTGFLSLREARRMGLDNFAVNYLWTKAGAVHKSPAELINELVRKEVAAAAHGG